MNLPPIIRQLNDRLAGWPDEGLTALLILIAVFTVVVALKGPPLFKAGVAAWFIAP